MSSPHRMARRQTVIVRPVHPIRPAPEARPALSLDQAVKTLGATVTVLYVIGLVAVNTAVYRLGVSAFDLVKATYVYTGALAAVPVLLSVLLPAFGFFSARVDAANEAKESEAKARHSDDKPSALAQGVARGFRWGRFLASSLTFAILPFIVYVVLLVIGGEIDDQTVFQGALRLFVSSLFLAFMILGLWVVLDEGKRSLADRFQIPRPLEIATTTVFLLLATGLYLNIFATTLYPAIPQQFGGGKPTVVRLALEAKALPGARALHIPISPDSVSTLPVEIAFDASDTYVLRLQDGSVVQINKGLVHAVRPGE